MFAVSALSPLQVAAWVDRQSPSGLVWLDSATGAPGAQSLIAATPARVLAGGTGDWPRFSDELAAFQGGHPGGAVVGWVEYGGAFRFGCYPHPSIYEHDTRQWHFPAGRPVWWPEGSQPPHVAALPWTESLNFANDVDAADFCAWLARAQEHIAAGDIYQVNLAHRLQARWPAGTDPFALYCALRLASPAPQAAFLALENSPTVLCASPEEFLRFEGRHARTRPIKGTRPRGQDAVADACESNALLASAKERAELLMITDLMRNDLGQVCDYHSIRVPELFRVETFAQVHHLVATIEGKLRPGSSHAVALAACLPGGSITGAPKKRAREIIAHLEPIPRGLYTGTIGCFGFGDPARSRFNIAIRTLLIEGDSAHFHVGAGIVADSVPAEEWQETLHKAAGILRATNSL